MMAHYCTMKNSIEKSQAFDGSCTNFSSLRASPQSKNYAEDVGDMADIFQMRVKGSTTL
jgi:hypothetical protein